jgi:hypothetical protein
MRLMTYVDYAAIILGVIAYVAGHFLGLAKAMHLGVFLAGFGLACAGIESLYSRRMSLRFSLDAAPNYAGFPALVWGGMLLAVGAATIVSAYLLNAGEWARVVAVLQTHHGVIYLAVGILMIGLSILVYVDTGGRLHWWETLVYRLPRVILGTILVVLGVLSAAAGVWQLLDPRGFAPFEHEVFAETGAGLRKIGLSDPFGASQH